MLTAEERTTIHNAMLAAKGDVRAAANLLQCELPALKEKLRADEQLKARWVEPVKVPSPVDTINREPPKVSASSLDLVDDIPPAEVALSEAVAKQDDRLRRLDWEGLGVTDPKTVNLMRAFEKFAGGQILQTIDATHGGMLHTFASVSARLEFIDAQIRKIEAKADGDKELNQDDSMKLMFLHKTFKDLADQKIKINDTAARAAYVRLQIIDRARKLQGAGNKLRKKAGWRRATPVPGPAKGNNGPK
jgi:hypothetical protein